MNAPGLPPSGLAPDAAAYEVPELGVVHVAGADAIKVLNGLCTANLSALAVGGATEAFFPDDRGRVLAHGTVARDADGAWIIGQLPDATELAAHIDRFIFREEAAPRDVTTQWHARLVDGGGAMHVLAAEFGIAQETLAAIDSGEINTPYLNIKVVRLPITSTGAQLWLVPKEQAVKMDSGLITCGLELADGAEFEARRIANFWPTAGREINERSLPQELDRDERAISFTKGCYLGQETVARLDALGEVQKKLCLVRLEGNEQVYEGDTLLRDSKEVGKLTSVAPNVIDDSRFALAYMRRGSFAAGSEFQLRDISGRVVAHP